jgi:large subunit ribosomal protein L35
MPKQKTHSGTKKRVRISRTGKVLRRRAFGNHFLQKKSAARKRVISSDAEITGAVKARVKRALGV